MTGEILANIDLSEGACVCRRFKDQHISVLEAIEEIFGEIQKRKKKHFADLQNVSRFKIGNTLRTRHEPKQLISHSSKANATEFPWHGSIIHVAVVVVHRSFHFRV